MKKNKNINETRKEALSRLSQGMNIDDNFFKDLFNHPEIFESDLNNDELFLKIKDFFYNFNKKSEINEEVVDSYVSILLKIIQNDTSSKLSLAISHQILPYIAFDCSKNVLEKWAEFDTTGESIVCMLTKQYSDANNTTENMHLPDYTILRAIERVRINAQAAKNSKLNETLFDGGLGGIDYTNIQLINLIERLKDNSDLYEKLLSLLYNDELNYQQDRRDSIISCILNNISDIDDAFHLKSLIDQIYAIVSVIDGQSINEKKPGKEADTRALKVFLKNIVSQVIPDTKYSLYSLEAIEGLCATMAWDERHNK